MIRTVDYSKLRRGVDCRKLRTIGQQAIIFRAGYFPYKSLRLLLIQLRQRFHQQRYRIIIIVNRKIGRKSRPFGISAQHPRSEGVEGSDTRPTRAFIKRPCPFRHFPSSFVGKGNCQNRFREHTLFCNQPRNFCCNNPRLSRTGACQNQKRRAGMTHGFKLFRI